MEFECEFGQKQKRTRDGCCATKKKETCLKNLIKNLIYSRLRQKCSKRLRPECKFSNPNGFVISSWLYYYVIVECSLAVAPSTDATAGGASGFAGECVGGPDGWLRLRLMVPDLLTVTAANLGNDEVHSFGDQFALLPGYRLTLIRTRPDLTRIYRILQTYYS